MWTFYSLIFNVFFNFESDLPVPDLWTLQTVSIETCNNRIYKGYIYIYKENFKNFQNEKDCIKSFSFKDSLENYLRYSRKIELYTDLLRSRSIYRGLILSSKDPNIFRLEEINVIERINGKYNGYNGGWSRINVVTEKELNLLKLKICSEYYIDEIGTNPIFISYTKRFKQFNLISLSNKYQKLNDHEQINFKKRVLSDSIVILQYTGD